MWFRGRGGLITNLALLCDMLTTPVPSPDPPPSLVSPTSPLTHPRTHYPFRLLVQPHRYRPLVGNSSSLGMCCFSAKRLIYRAPPFSVSQALDLGSTPYQFPLQLFQVWPLFFLGVVTAVDPVNDVGRSVPRVAALRLISLAVPRF